jgi:uncharacterized Zn-binding protein involved in type VI secretion
MRDASRPTDDGEGWIYKGDLTDHGGVVIEGYEHCTWDSIPVARLGCKVYCPKCGDIHTIIEANGFPVHDVKFAIENDLTSCGARVLAKRAPASLVAVAQAFSDGKPLFDEKIKFKTPEGKLLANLDYVITLSDGEKIHGTTDDNGMSDRIFTTQKTDIVKVVFNLDTDTGECGNE